MNAITQEVGGEVFDAERNQVRRVVVDGGIEAELKGRIGGLAIEHVEGVAADELHRGGREAYLQGIEVIEQVTVFVVDTAVAFVCNNQVEEAHIELGEAVHHARVGGDVNACGLIDLVGFTNHAARLAGQVLLEGLIGLHAQLLAITQEQHALSPTGAQQQLGQRNSHASLARAGGLDDQRAAALLLKVSGDRLDGFNLIGAVSDMQIRVMTLQNRFAVLALVDQVFEAVLAVEAIHRAVGVVLRVVPDEGFVAVAVENHRALHAHALESIGVHARLFAPGFQADIAGFLGLDHGQGLTVVAP
ncbi:hypothetical protein FQZ97_727740 [compost metagenome]